MPFERVVSCWSVSQHEQVTKTISEHAIKVKCFKRPGGQRTQRSLHHATLLSWLQQQSSAVETRSIGGVHLLILPALLEVKGDVLVCKLSI